MRSSVGDLAVTCPEVHAPETTVGELEKLFLDDHVHMALLVQGRRLVAAVERSDLRPGLDPELPARLVGTLRGRVIAPEAAAADALALMRSTGRRRLAVVGVDGALLGLLCLKARGDGFCSNGDVASRRHSHGRPTARELAQIRV